MIIVIENSMPKMIGVLRAIDKELVLRIMKSEIIPPLIPPIKPQIAGTAAAKPTSLIFIPRCVAK